MRRLISVSCVIILALFAAGSARAQYFSGFYVGGYAGGSVNTAVAQTTTVFNSSGYFASTSVPAIASAGNMSFDLHGITGGGQTGYNFRFGHFVIGPELDFGSLRLNAAASATLGYPCCSPTTLTISQAIKTRGLFTARARAGVAFGRFLFYGTFGGALTNINYQEVFSDTFAGASENAGAKVDQAGYVGGGGVEIALSRHWSMKGEFLYANFGTLTNTSTNLVVFTMSEDGASGVRALPALPGSTSFPQNPFTISTTLTEKIGRFGINYRF